MKRIAVLAILAFCSLVASAQAPGDSITVNVGIPKSYGAGYATFAIGANAEFWKQLSVKRRIFIGGRVGLDRQRKDYLDSGITLRGSVYARFGLPIGQNWAIRPFIGGGVAFSQQRNPQYIKSSYSPRIEAGVHTKDGRFFAYMVGFLPDSTENKLRGGGLAFDYYYPLTPRFSLHGGLIITRFKFYQPYGNYKGWYTGGGWTPTFGLTYHFKEKYDRPGWAVPNPPQSKPVAPIVRGQSFVTDFEKQFLRKDP